MYYRQYFDKYKITNLKDFKGLCDYMKSLIKNSAKQKPEIGEKVLKFKDKKEDVPILTEEDSIKILKKKKESQEVGRFIIKGHRKILKKQALQPTTNTIKQKKPENFKEITSRKQPESTVTFITKCNSHKIQRIEKIGRFTASQNISLDSYSF